MGRKDTIGFKIRLIHNQIHKTMEAKRRENEREGLTGMQRWTMGFLKDHGGEDIYQKDIEAEFSVSRATASNMLQLMERKELIERIPVEHDGRLKKIVLTSQACQMMERARLDIEEMEESLTAGMDPEEVALFQNFLNRVLQNLGVDDLEEHTRCCSEKGKNPKCKK